MFGWQFRVCEVCRWIDRDLTLKPCMYCSRCDSWICEVDLQDWYRRGLAALLSGRGKLGGS